MASNNSNNDRTVEHVRANLTGAYVAIAGVLILNVAVFMDWTSSDEADTSYTGYESDSLWPFAAYLGIGFAAALLYAGSRAYRRQHRGLSLASMAVALAVTLQTVAWIFDVPGAAERGGELTEEIGAYVGLLGAALWAIGSGLLAKEPEGDIEHDHVSSDDTTHRAGSGSAR